MSDLHGRWAFVIPAPQEGHLYATHRDYAPSQPLQVGVADADSLRLQLRDARAVSGVVLSSEREPSSGGVVVARQGAIDQIAHIDARGRFVLFPVADVPVVELVAYLPGGDRCSLPLHARGNVEGVVMTPEQR